jgi:hypothetical protein
MVAGEVDALAAVACRADRNELAVDGFGHLPLASFEADIVLGGGDDAYDLAQDHRHGHRTEAGGDLASASGGLRRAARAPASLELVCPG